jgi:predicted anti-sigma-YlaC factor YlaD
VALAPAWASGSLPFLGAFTALLLASTVRDLGAGQVHVDRALVHLLVLAGVVVVALLAWRRRRPAARSRTAVSSRRVVA